MHSSFYPEDPSRAGSRDGVCPQSRPEIIAGKCILWLVWSFNFEASFWVCYALRAPFIFRHIKCSSTFPLVLVLPFERVFQGALCKGDQAGSDGVDGLSAQLKPTEQPLIPDRGWLGILDSRLRLISVFLSFRHEHSVNLKAICEFLQVLCNSSGSSRGNMHWWLKKVRATIFDSLKALQLCRR